LIRSASWYEPLVLLAAAVGHPATATTWVCRCADFSIGRPEVRGRSKTPSPAFGVCHPDIWETMLMSDKHTPIAWPLSTLSCFLRRKSSGVPFAGFATAVGQPAVSPIRNSEFVISNSSCSPVEALADMWRADAMCAQYLEPEGVTDSFQV
jgi:hypothetical protein